jgi:hypothetical protein
VRPVVTALRELDGPDLHAPVAMAVGGPKAQAQAAELADTANFVMPHTETHTETTQRVRDFDNHRNVELALHVPVIGDSVAPFMAGPNTDTAAIRAVDSVSFLPSDPAAAAEEIQRRREEMGFSPALSLRSSPSWPDGGSSRPAVRVGLVLALGPTLTAEQETGRVDEESQLAQEGVGRHRRCRAQQLGGTTGNQRGRQRTVPRRHLRHEPQPTTAVTNGTPAVRTRSLWGRDRSGPADTGPSP